MEKLFVKSIKLNAATKQTRKLPFPQGAVLPEFPACEARLNPRIKASTSMCTPSGPSARRKPATQVPAPVPTWKAYVQSPC